MVVPNLDPTPFDDLTWEKIKEFMKKIHVKNEYNQLEEAYVNNFIFT